MLTQQQLIDALREIAPDECKNASPGQIEEAAVATLNNSAPPAGVARLMRSPDKVSDNPLFSRSALIKKTHEAINDLKQKLGRKPSAQEVSAETKRRGLLASASLIEFLLKDIL